MFATPFQSRDLRYAKALMPIIAAVEKGEITISPSGSRYLVAIKIDGHVINLIPKKSKTQKQIKATTWGFNFTTMERDSLAQMVNSNQRVFLCLICGDKALCAIEGKAAVGVMTPDSGKQQLSLRVKFKNGMFYVINSNKIPVCIRKYSRSYSTIEADA